MTRRTSVPVACAYLAAGIFGAQFAQARELTFENRVKAQEAIERVYYFHQIGSTLPFEEALPRAAIEEKVRKYLQQSEALEKIWNTPITAEMLQTEMDRIVRGSRLPERLLEIHAALGGDAFVMEECLARATLADRLARNRFAFDARIHAEARAEAEQLHTDLAAGRRDPFAGHSNRRVIEIVANDGSVEGEIGPDRVQDANHEFTRRDTNRLELSQREYAEERAKAPQTVGTVGALSDEREAFVIRVLLAEKEGVARIAKYAVPKVTWDAWWSAVAAGLDERSVTPVAAATARIPVERLTRQASIGAANEGAEAAVGSCLPDTWDNGSLDDMPDPRAGHAAVWTGNRMIVWGGSAHDTYYQTGGMYDPATDTWTATSTNGAPEGRFGATAVWTGSRMVVWGGDRYSAGFIYYNTGGVYDPATDTWTATSIAGAPTGRYDHTAVWTGSRMVIWGGYEVSTIDGRVNTGGVYDPVTNTWTATTTVGAPAGRSTHSAVWTGNRMIVWGGAVVSGVNTGGIYDPASDTWTGMSITAAPAGRYGHIAVWTGSRMVVWGGTTGGGTYLNTGGVYDPAMDTWSSTSTVDPPVGRAGSVAVWTGSRMVVWGGYREVNFNQTWVDTGGIYDPTGNNWTATSMAGAPTKRGSHTGVWTGSRMIVWGGLADGNPRLNSGGLFDPATDTWTATSLTSAPSGRSSHTAVWTGSRMVVWGGYSESYVRTGGSYDPTTDAWTATSLTNAPSGRSGHTAVWTGSRMVVWGGYDGFSVNTGGIYDPAMDTWTETETTGGPGGRYGHSAVWTGSRMVVWGGNQLNTGGMYDPVMNTWTLTSLNGAPIGRENHTAVWTGSRMIVWGGRRGPSLNTGGEFDPATNTWTATSLTGAPGGSERHSAVWTGSRMIVWGGYTGGGFIQTGGVYDPATGTWTTMSTELAPAGRAGQATVWTGSRMVVWGGNSNFTYPNTGGVYDLATNSWTATSLAAAPAGREGQSGVWIGSSMVVWGGFGYGYFNGGGRYCAPASCSVDADCDDGDFCTTDVCDPTAECLHAAVVCDDADACTTETCDPATGCVVSPVICDDSDACTSDSCVAGTCENDPIVCDDGVYCNGVETCFSESGCVPAAPVVCDDGVDCTADSCDEDADTCRHAPVSALCDDGNVCTDDTCTATGCVSSYNVAPCNDNNSCTRLDVCSSGVCLGGDPVICIAADQCLVAGVCDSMTGLCSSPNAPDGTPCNDSNTCTTGDACAAGSCVGDPLPETRPQPKTKGYFKKLCKGPHHGDTLTAADATCVATVAPLTFGWADSLPEVCEVLGVVDGHDSDNTHTDRCSKSEDELMALALNICTARVCTSQPIDVDDTDLSSTASTVGEALAEADAIFSDPARDGVTCKVGEKLCKGINNGKFLRMDSLRLDKLANGDVELTWMSPYLGNDQEVTDYEIWRSLRGAGAFTLIRSITTTSFVDRDEGDFDYEIVAVIRE